jgi:hypothetical protein
MATLIVAACLSLGVMSAVPDAPSSTNDVYQGKIAAISKASISLVDRGGENKSFLLSEESKITINGKPASWQDVGVGNMAKIKATGDLAAPVAMVVEIRSVEHTVVIND